MFCPTCTKPLAPVPMIDIRGNAVECAQGHRFHWFPRSVSLEESIRSSHVAPPPMASTEDAIRYWLTQEQARIVLADSLAELLERILSYNTGRRVHIEPTFSHRPRCAAALKPFEDGDLYVRHCGAMTSSAWGMRGSDVGTIQEPRIELNSERPDVLLMRDAQFWLENQAPLFRLMVPPSVRGVLQEFLDRAINL